MPRRAAKVTQADISRAIRAAKESGAGEVTIDSGGTIRISLAVPSRREPPAEPPAKPAPILDEINNNKRLATPRRAKGT